jgi:GntR family transcriptional regulator, rspAB operon transcriptional repressor
VTARAPQIMAIDRRSPVGTQTYEAIRASILELVLPPGHRLSEKELSLQLGVSRTPVREAFIKLAREGLVVVYPQAGTFVSKIRRDHVLEAQFVREALECAAIRDAVERATDDDIAALRRIVVHQRTGLQDEGITAFYGLDEDLHRRMIESSGHPMAWEITRQVRVHLDRVRRLSLPVPHQIEELIGQHHEIVEALAARDAEHAVQALSRHLRETGRIVDVLAERHPDFFET